MYIFSQLRNLTVIGLGDVDLSSDLVYPREILFTQENDYLPKRKITLCTAVTLLRTFFQVINLNQFAIGYNGAPSLMLSC